jgi:rSAM/selenodomain-associated transferase 2
MRLSIIIPTLNEARHLAAAVTAVRHRAEPGGPHEILVADCGSVDGTENVAARLNVCAVTSDPPPDTRAAALNLGAAAATGEVFLFLDADSLVPRGYERAIRAALRDSQVVGGAFEFALDGRGLGLRCTEFLNRIRYRLWSRFYGDQGIFVRAETFRRIGGYPARRILEASDFSRALARRGRLALIHRPMVTSARRFVEGGVWHVLAHDVWIWWLDLLGRPTERFARAYQANNHQRGDVNQCKTGSN